MRHLKPFSLSEGDWWDNDPSAPWNAPDDPEPEADIEYPEAKRDFILLAHVSDEAILRRKADNTVWVLDTTDIGEDDEYRQYLYHVPAGDDMERIGGYEDEEYASIATDLFKDGKYSEGKEAWDDRDGEMRLYKVDLEMAEALIEDYVYSSKPRPGVRMIPGNEGMKQYRAAATILSREFPEAEA